MAAEARTYSSGTVEVNGPGGCPEVEVSVVMPCLDEVLTVGRCVSKALGALNRLGARGEVIVADNGSTDGSPEVARRHGARVVTCQRLGYGYALQAGIQAARGRYVIMGDADDSYDFDALEPFLDCLRQGDALVMGNRFRGEIKPGAMPALHRYVGNPLLTGFLNLLFGSPIGDAHCGLRAFRREAYHQLGLSAGGMEFATEMVVKACLHRQKISEVPIVLHPDGRDRPPHLRTFRDGWRHLKFMLMCCPMALFILPGSLLALVGPIAIPAAMAAGRGIFTKGFGPNFLFSCALLSICGVHLLAFGLLAKLYAQQVDPAYYDPGTARLARLFTVERGLVAAALLLIAAAALGLPVLVHWLQTASVPVPGRWIAAGTLGAIGLEILFTSFLVGILEAPRKASEADAPIAGG